MRRGFFRMPRFFTCHVQALKRIPAVLCLIVIFLIVVPASQSIAAQEKETKGPKNIHAFNFAAIAAKAKELAAKPFSEPAKISEQLLRMSYDQWRNIRFRQDASLWRTEKLPFELQFFHPGLFYDRAVKINIVEGAKFTPLSVKRDMFNYGRNPLQQSLPVEVGAAGFRIHSPIKTKEYYDEFLVFLGASYLRGVGNNHHYGLSARGLAVNVATEEGEEFPWFREFWIIKPKKGDKSILAYALLDSPSMTGAYSYKATPGTEMKIEVESQIFIRKPVKKLGIAPLTSMFFFGENTSPKTQEDYRPEVHDSDGLLINFASGEWLWRPAHNPRTLQIAAFKAPDVKGFGLLQRDQDFKSYEDLEARYEIRPSVWIEAKGDWGPGIVEFVQIPTDSEVNDNLVAFWRPEQPVSAGASLRFDYTMTWLTPAHHNSPPGYVTATRISKGNENLQKIFIVDWDGPALQKLDAEAKLDSVVTVEGGGARLLEQQIYRNQITGGWRLAIHIAVESESAIGKMMPDKRPPIELRAFLKHDADILTETWSYAYKP